MTKLHLHTGTDTICIHLNHSKKSNVWVMALDRLGGMGWSCSGRSVRVSPPIIVGAPVDLSISHLSSLWFHILLSRVDRLCWGDNLFSNNHLNLGWDGVLGGRSVKVSPPIVGWELPPSVTALLPICPSMLSHSAGLGKQCNSLAAVNLPGIFWDWQETNQWNWWVEIGMEVLVGWKILICNTHWNG